MSDRNENASEESENGVLAGTGSIDTSSIDLLSSATVAIELPLHSHQEDDDDDVVDGENTSPFEPDLLPLGEPVGRDAQPDADADDADEDDADADDADEVVTGELEAEDSPSDDADPADDEPTDESAGADAAEAPADAAAPEDALDADAPAVEDDAPEVVASAAVTPVEDETPAEEDPAPADEPVAGSGDTIEADAADDDVDVVAAPDHAEPVDDARDAAPVDAEPVAEPVAESKLASAPQRAHAEPVAPIVVATAPVAPPATRRAAHHHDDDRRALERHRFRAPAETALQSRRIGDLDAGGESSDLLTAERLLDPAHVVRPEPEGAWQHFVYRVTGHQVNLGDGRKARERKELDRRITVPLAGGAKFVPVLSRKGGVGKTTVTTLLGMALADARDDRIIAVDANPDRGTLADRIARTSGHTVRDLARRRGEVVGFNDLSALVARDETRLDVLASDADPRVSEALSDRDYHDVASIAAHYYSIVLTDTGTGIVHSVMEATLELADQLVIVAGLSVEEARLASETLTWLETNGFAEQVRGAVVVLNAARPGATLVRPEELDAHFRSRVRAVVRLPYDPHVAAGSAVAFRELRPETRRAARELAAVVIEGLRTPTAAG